MVEMNIQSVLNDLGVQDVEVTHFDMGSATPDAADAFFVGADLADSAQHLGNVIILDSIIDMDELKQKVQAECEKQGLM